jgi:hypothetical protein
MLSHAHSIAKLALLVLAVFFPASDASRQCPRPGGPLDRSFTLTDEYAPLVSWLTSHGAFFPKLDVREENGLRGVWSNAAIEPGEEILFIPQPLILIPDVLEQTVGDLLKPVMFLAPPVTFQSQDCAFINDYHKVVTFLLWQRFLDVEKTSLWTLYFESLPSDVEIDELSPWLWPKANQQQFAGLPFQKNLISMVEAVDRMYNATQTCVRALEHVTWTDVGRAYFLAASRLFRVNRFMINHDGRSVFVENPEAGSTTGFVPFADLVNHDEPAQVRFFWGGQSILN